METLNKGGSLPGQLRYRYTRRKELSPRKNTRRYTKESHSLPYYDNNRFRWLVLVTG